MFFKNIFGKKLFSFRNFMVSVLLLLLRIIPYLSSEYIVLHCVSECANMVEDVSSENCALAVPYQLQIKLIFVIHFISFHFISFHSNSTDWPLFVTEHCVKTVILIN